MMRALAFATDKHAGQTWTLPGGALVPYIKHPIGVAKLIADAGVTDAEVLAGALLHDTVEDTATTFEEIRDVFGEKVEMYVREVTDDGTLRKDAKKMEQIERVSKASDGGKLIKIADKIFNLSDLQQKDGCVWDTPYVIGYFVWCKRVIDVASGVNAALDARAAEVLAGTFFEKGTGKELPCIPPGADLEVELEKYYALCRGETA